MRWMTISNLLCKVERNQRYISSYWKKLVREFKLFDFDYKFLSGYSLPPKSICLILTERCNLKCVMCDIGQKNACNSSYPGFPLVESIKKGGEPMTLNDWKMIDVVCQLTRNDFNGKISAELQVLDARKANS